MVEHKVGPRITATNMIDKENGKKRRVCDARPRIANYFRVAFFSMHRIIFMEVEHCVFILLP
jgi:hypothetical protein